MWVLWKHQGIFPAICMTLFYIISVKYKCNKNQVIQTERDLAQNYYHGIKKIGKDFIKSFIDSVWFIKYLIDTCIDVTY